MAKGDKKRDDKAGMKEKKSVKDKRREKLEKMKEKSGKDCY